MRRVILLTLTLGALVLAGCGGHSKTSLTQAGHSKDAQAGVTFADQVAAKCVPNVFVLRNHAGRVKAKACVVSAVPPAKRKAFGACVTKALESSRSKATFKAKLNGCYLSEVKA